ncbi:uncharacterized protein LOC128204745 [Mya arenaria]|uniref:uncharacterized protein LOC128204745 n=1 Tax=Mya arenaria TaxID=6604 RepID=UPI0022E1CA80|nr:uncharacterized protein LOC128204745 [Mya arenaria]
MSLARLSCMPSPVVCLVTTVGMKLPNVARPAEFYALPSRMPGYHCRYEAAQCPSPGRVVCLVTTVGMTLPNVPRPAESYDWPNCMPGYHCGYEAAQCPSPGRVDCPAELCSCWGRAPHDVCNGRPDTFTSECTWYLDGTFRVVNKPFTQLWSVHAFLRQGATTKQVPLLCVLMSRRRKNDYEAVLRKIVELMDVAPVVEAFTMDFEAGWHRRMNARAGRGQLQFYVLLGLLLKEAKLVPLQAQLVGEGIGRNRREVYSDMDMRIDELWEKYDAHDILCEDFLREIGEIYG